MSKHPFTLIQGRLGIYNKTPYESSGVDGIDATATRLEWHGGHL
jgi:hypothetical protein